MEISSSYPEAQKSGLSVVSFIFSFIGRLLCMTLIGIFLGAPLASLGFILGIVALIKKQKKWPAITGIVIGGTITLVNLFIMIMGYVFVTNNEDVFVQPIKEIAAMIQTDPEMKATVTDMRFEQDFELAFRENISGKIHGLEVNTWDEAKGVIKMIFDETKITLVQIKERYNSMTGFIYPAASVPFLGEEITLEGTGENMVPTEIAEAQNSCETNADCIPLPSECHPTACINKTFESEYTKPEMCTRIFMIEAAYNAEDCECLSNVCSNKNLGKK